MLLTVDSQLRTLIWISGYSDDPYYYLGLLNLDKINNKLERELKLMFKAYKDDPDFIQKYNRIPEPTAAKVCILVSGGIVQEVYCSEPMECHVNDTDIEGADNPEDWNNLIKNMHKIL